MKNLHLLPTDKPSRLIKSQDNTFIYLNTNAPNWFENNLKTIKQNIYITSDEEIKEGDWCLSKLNEVILFGRSYNEITYKEEHMLDFSYWLTQNIGKYTNDRHAHFMGEYLKEWNKKQQVKVNGL